MLICIMYIFYELCYYLWRFSSIATWCCVVPCIYLDIRREAAGLRTFPAFYRITWAHFPEEIVLYSVTSENKISHVYLCLVYVYLTTLSIFQITWSRMMKLSINNEQKNKWKEADVTFDGLFGFFMDETRKMTKTWGLQVNIWKWDFPKKISNSARTWRAVRSSVADQSTLKCVIIFIQLKSLRHGFEVYMSCETWPFAAGKHENFQNKFWIFGLEKKVK